LSAKIESLKAELSSHDHDPELDDQNFRISELTESIKEKTANLETAKHQKEHQEALNDERKARIIHAHQELLRDMEAYLMNYNELCKKYIVP
jgi:hypothetical protein